MTNKELIEALKKLPLDREFREFILSGLLFILLGFTLGAQYPSNDSKAGCYLEGEAHAYQDCDNLILKQLGKPTVTPIPTPDYMGE